MKKRDFTTATFFCWIDSYVSSSVSLRLVASRLAQFSRQKFIASANLCEMIISALENNLSGLEDVADMQRTFFATIERVENMRKFLSTKPEGWSFALKWRLFDIEVFLAITHGSFKALGVPELSSSLFRNLLVSQLYPLWSQDPYALELHGCLANNELSAGALGVSDAVFIMT